MADETDIPEPQDAEPSLADELRATLAETEGASSTEQPRDEHGRFAPKTPDPVETAGALHQPAPAQSDAVAAVPPAPASDDLPLPAHWSDAEKARWAALPAEHKALLLDARKSIEAGFDQKFKTVAEERKQYARYSEIDRVLEPHRGRMRQYGASEPEVIHRLLTAEAALAGPNRVEAFRQLASAYGIPLSALAGQGAEAAMDDDPRAREIAELRQQVFGLAQGYQSMTAAQQQERINAQNRQIEQFTQAKDDKGQLLHPHVDRVVDHMTPLFAAKLNAGVSLPDALKTAYEEAVWANPDVRREVIAAEEAKRAADATRRAAVDQAKRAGGNVRATPLTTATAPASTGSLRDELRRTYAELTG